MRLGLNRLSGLAEDAARIRVLVLTGTGKRAVESLKRGDWLVTREGRAPVIAVEARAARVAPVRVGAEALGHREFVLTRLYESA